MLMTTNTTALDVQWSSLLLRKLLKGCDHRVLFSSGKRSQPIMLALLRLREELGLELIAHYDERGTTFAAMGAARSVGKPLLVLTTSGSAVANLLPGLCEAMSQQVPLIVITADRPPEEHGRGTSQTWPHLPLLAGATLKQFALPCPDASNMEQVLEVAVEALSYAKYGPVHINCPFYEPFHHTHADTISFIESAREPTLESPIDAQPLLEQLAAAKRPLVTLGASWEPVQEALLRRMLAVGVVIVPDIISQWGLKKLSGAPLKSTAGLNNISSPDLWVHLGGTLLERKLLQWLKQHKPNMLLVVDGPQHWDPAFCNPRRWQHDPCRYVLNDDPDINHSASEWQAEWAAHGPATANDPWWEYCHRAMSWLWLQLPQDAIWFAGNSRAIRMASALPLRDDAPKIWANRGLAGIDGNLATGLGMALATKKPIVICVGDLTALHDINSLALLRYIKTPVTILVLNDYGGGIFKQVITDVAEAELMEGFVTPHDFQLTKIADFYGLHAHAGVLPPTQDTLAGHVLWEVRLQNSWH